jgi:hypothetical protein
MSKPSIETIISAIGGKPSRDGLSVVVSMGGAGYIRATPDYIILDGKELPAIALDADGCRGGKGRMLATLREKARAAGLEIA